MAKERGVKADWFAAMFYEEDYEAFKEGVDLYGIDYVMIRHDRCKDEEGNTKKAHYHAVLFQRNGYQFTFAARLGLDKRKIKPPKADKPNGAVRYLLHLDNPEKAQYKREDIETTLEAADLDKLFEKIESGSNAIPDSDKVLDDIEKLASGKMGYKSFLKAHPAFIYQAASLWKLVGMAGSANWQIIDKETGEVV